MLIAGEIERQLRARLEADREAAEVADIICRMPAWRWVAGMLGFPGPLIRWLVREAVRRCDSGGPTASMTQSPTQERAPDGRRGL